MSKGSLSDMSATTSIPRARDEENHFLLVERGGPVGEVLVHQWLPECHQQKEQGLTDRIVHLGVYIRGEYCCLDHIDHKKG